MVTFFLPPLDSESRPEYHTKVWEGGVMSRQQKLNQILAQNPQVAMAAKTAYETKPSFLRSKINELDDCFGGGLAWGQLSEWGMPMGCGGRELLLAFLAKATRERPPVWCLWVYPSSEGLAINAVAWAARGIDLQYLRYVCSDYPVSDLQALLWENFFQLVIFDAPRALRSEECAFLARNAQRHHQIIAIVRPYFLSSQRGNIWSRLRVNCWYESTTDLLQVDVVRGLSPRRISLPRKVLSEGEVQHADAL